MDIHGGRGGYFRGNMRPIDGPRKRAMRIAPEELRAMLRRRNQKDPIGHFIARDEEYELASS